MTDKEADKIIAEYMGGYCSYSEDMNIMITYVGTHHETMSSVPTESLDVLIPVWEKMDMCQKIIVNKNFRMVGLGYSWSISSEKKTTQQSAAHATAEAIQKGK